MSPDIEPESSYGTPRKRVGLDSLFTPEPKPDPFGEMLGTIRSEFDSVIAQRDALQRSCEDYRISRDLEMERAVALARDLEEFRSVSVQLIEERDAARAQFDRFRNALHDKNEQIERLRRQFNGMQAQVQAAQTVSTLVLAERDKALADAAQYAQALDAVHADEEKVATLERDVRVLRRNLALAQTQGAVERASFMSMRADRDRWRAKYIAVAPPKAPQDPVAAEALRTAGITPERAEELRPTVEQMHKIAGTEYVWPFSDVPSADEFEAYLKPLREALQARIDEVGPRLARIFEVLKPFLEADSDRHDG